MSISKRKGRVSIRYKDAAGKHVRETLGVVTDAQARKVHAMRVAEAKKGYIKPTSISFESLANEWFDVTAVQKQWVPRTLRSHRDSLRRVKVLNRIRVEDLRRGALERLAEKLLETYSAKTVNMDLTVIYQVLDYGVRKEYLHQNVAAKQSRPRIKKKAWRILTPTEIQTVDGFFEDKQAQLIFRTLVRTGLRRGEIQQLRVQDVDFLRGALRVVQAKTEEGERWIALSEWLVSELMSHCMDKPETGLVFTSSRGNSFNDCWYGNEFRRALKKAGITDYVRPFHDMRHTSLTNEAATAQSNPMALMARAGHRSMSTTRQYTHLAGVLFPDQAKALEALYGGKT